MDEPPYDINGRVIPFVGNRLRLDDIFIRVCKIKMLDNPKREEKIKKFFSLNEIIYIL